MRISTLGAVALITLPWLSCSAAQQTGLVSFQYSVDPATGSVLKGRRIHVILRNESPVDVSIIQIELKLDADLSNARQDLTTPLLPCTGRADPYHVEEQIAPGKEVDLWFEYPKGSFWLPLRNFDLATLEPGSHTLTFKAQVQNPVTRETTRFPKSVDLDVQAPNLAIVLGGAVGAFILTLLRAGYRRLRKGRARLTWQTELREAGLTILVGALIAFILTFAGGLLSSRIFGIQIAATSYKGGMIIGLCSYKIGDILVKKLWK